MLHSYTANQERDKETLGCSGRKSTLYPQSLACVKVLNYDFNKYTEVIGDGSPFGLGAMLVQDKLNHVGKVVAYSSRSLSEVE